MIRHHGLHRLLQVFIRPAALVAILLATLSLTQGGCASTTTVEVLNTTTEPVQITQVEVPRTSSPSVTSKESVISTAHLAPGKSTLLSVREPSDANYVQRLRALPILSGNTPATQWIDLPARGNFLIRISAPASAAAGMIQLTLEDRPRPEQADADERQRRDIIDRPPSTFDRHP